MTHTHGHTQACIYFQTEALLGGWWDTCSAIKHRFSLLAWGTGPSLLASCNYTHTPRVTITQSSFLSFFMHAVPNRSFCTSDVSLLFQIHSKINWSNLFPQELSNWFFFCIYGLNITFSHVCPALGFTCMTILDPTTVGKHTLFWAEEGSVEWGGGGGSSSCWAHLFSRHNKMLAWILGCVTDILMTLHLWYLFDHIKCRNSPYTQVHQAGSSSTGRSPQGWGCMVSWQSH